MQRSWISAIFFVSLASLMLAGTVHAEITQEQRREIAAMKKQVARLGGLIRRDRFDDAEKIIDEAEALIEKVVEEAGIEKDDRLLKSLLEDLERYEEQLSKAMNSDSGDTKPEQISFLGDVAPLIDSKCLGCHGANNPRAGLRLDNLAGWRRGGRNGPILRPKAANRSLLIARLMAPADQGRMPQRGEPLSQEEIETIGKWINEGANVGKVDPTKSLADLIYEHEMTTMSIEIPKPKGTETVSFTRDMAPWMANLCLNCHNSRNKSGGLSVETFFDLMKGGDSGEVIIPGDMDNSRFFRLVGGKELPRMPQGQARITRKNYEDMMTWFREGNTFDGADPRTNINTYVRTPAQMMADEFRNKTDEEMVAHRKEQSESQLKKSVPNDPQNFVDTEHFLMAGNVDNARLKEVGGWAETRLDDLHKMFGGEGLPWRGKLAVFVLKDRFSYDEFNEVVEQRRADVAMKGHSRVTPNYEQAYIAIEDVGDNSSDELSTEKNLVEHLAGAYLKQKGSALPNWIISGTGLMLAIDGRTDAKRVAQLRQTASSLVPTVQRPEDIFDDGTFSPGTIGAVGYTLVQFLVESQGNAKFAQLVGQLQQGQQIASAIQNVYGSSLQQVARAYAGSLNR